MTGDPNAELNAQGDMALISNQYKIIIGSQYGRGIWFGPVYPNSTTATGDQPSYPCRNGCLYDIIQDPTEHANLKDTLPDVYTAMLRKLLAHGRTVFQTDYKEPGTDQCFTGTQAASYYVGHNTCIKGGPGYKPSLPSCDATRKQLYLGPMCFKHLPPVPPPPPPPLLVTIAPATAQQPICEPVPCS